MPFLSVIVPTMRCGGLDFLIYSLARQSFTDFELVLVDGLHSRRAQLVADEAPRLGLRVVHVEPQPNPFPNVAFCKYANTGLIYASGDVAVFMVDYTRLPADVLAKHAAFHRGDATGRRGMMGPHRYVKLSPYSGFPRYDRHEADRYHADLASGALDRFVWSTGTTDGTPDDPHIVDGGGVAQPDADPKLRMAFGPVDSNAFHAKNESVRLEHALAINGWDEDLDGAHVYQDSDFADRLAVKAGVSWTVDPSAVVEIVNPRHVFPFARRTRDYRTNETIWQGKRAAGYPTPNGYNLRQERECRSR